MDEADDPDPDPDGWPVHPAAAFYGLWPRFAVEAEEMDGAVSAESEPGPAE
jgi:hypothetical protein